MNLYKALQQREAAGKPIRIGAIGAGKFCTTFLTQALSTPGMRIVGVADLTTDRARQACLRAGFADSRLASCTSASAINDAGRRGQTALVDDGRKLIDADLDVIIELTGIPEAGANYAWQALDTGKHVIMVNVEADVLLGLALKRRADERKLVYSMAYGDQPALICEEIDWARAAGFEVVCAGKGTSYRPEFNYSTPATVWKYYGFSEEQVKSGDYNPQMYNSFLDGTKSAIEMCAVANASGLLPQQAGLQFPPVSVDKLPDFIKPKAAGEILEHSGTVEVLANTLRDGTPVKPDFRHGVFVVFRAQTPYAKSVFPEVGVLRDASGEYGALYRPMHYIGLELGISVAYAALKGEPTGTTSSFIADVVSVAKKDLKPGDVLDGEGGYAVFGRLAQAKESVPGKYLPIGLSAKAKVIRPVAKSSIVTYEDVSLDTNLFSYKLRKGLEQEF